MSGELDGFSDFLTLVVTWSYKYIYSMRVDTLNILCAACG